MLQLTALKPTFHFKYDEVNPDTYCTYTNFCMQHTSISSSLLYYWLKSRPLDERRRIGKSVEFAVKLEILQLCYKCQGSFLRTEKKLKGRLCIIHHLKNIHGVSGFIIGPPITVPSAMCVQNPHNLKDNSILSSSDKQCPNFPRMFCTWCWKS